jgi:Leucine-rich repeat (LRR) protein
MQNTKAVQENTRRERNFLKDSLAVLQEDVNMAHNMNARHRDELQKNCQTQTEKLELRANTSFQQTSDIETEQMRRQLTTKNCCIEGRDTGKGTVHDT